MRRGSIVRILGLTVVFVVVQAIVAVAFKWLPTSASRQMDRITFVYWFATVICIAIFALVMAAIVYSVWQFRAQPDDESDGLPIHGHTGLEIGWTVVPALLVIAIGVVSAIVLSQNGRAGTNPDLVKVTAQQFEWSFEYPTQKKLKTHELVLRVNHATRLDFKALDVIHSFWVPEFGQKQDAVPGIDTHLVVTPTRIGQFTLICTELCGLGHATMRAAVEVVDDAGFAAWIKKQQAGGSTGDPGAAAFVSGSCGGCHAFKPAGSVGQIGPGLDNLEADAKKAGQPLADYVKQAIVAPNAYLVPSYKPDVMPKTFGQSLSPQQIDALVKYLTGTA